MIEVYKDLFVGNDRDYHAILTSPGWFFIQACKEPYHRQALGYRSRGAPKTSPEYFWAERENRLILNLVDADDPAYIPKEVVNKAIETLKNQLPMRKVLLHCNQGRSRSPSIAFLYLVKHTKILNTDSLESALVDFQKLYPGYDPALGVKGYIRENWRG
ncbi:hypothetical protein [uncultured Gilvimarinus sp.]|uniref:hypothetical protein n=1 Tax=uncultured Gilvimarinus sp. TaxID=1689143 RepID=UPI0030D7E104